MSRSTPENVIFRSRALFVAILLGAVALTVFAHYFAIPKIAAGLVGLGGLSLWVAQHYYVTKQPVYRKGGPFIEFEKEPGNHTSAVFASCVLGLFFIFAGASIFLSH